jgi:hypothetical protein
MPSSWLMTSMENGRVDLSHQMHAFGTVTLAKARDLNATVLSANVTPLHLLHCLDFLHDLTLKRRKTQTRFPSPFLRFSLRYHFCFFSFPTFFFFPVFFNFPPRSIYLLSVDFDLTGGRMSRIYYK